MSQSSENKKIYTSEDIRQYVEGKMDPAAMHAFEKALMDDPFLADAFEGLQQTTTQYGEKVFPESMELLKEKLATRMSIEKTTPVIPLSRFRWLKIAAAASIILIAGIFTFKTYFSSNQIPESSIALNDSQQKTGPVPVQPTLDSITMSPEATINPSAPGNTAIPPTLVPDNTRTAAGKKTTAPENKQTPVRDANAVVSSADPSSTTDARSLSQKNEDREKSIAAPAAPIRPGDTANVASAARFKATEWTKDVPDNQSRTIAKNNQPAANLQNSYKGIIIAENNSPIENAVIQVNKEQQYVTDKKGTFSITSKDSQILITVTSVGYATRQFNLKNNSPFNELQLGSTSNNLSETVVIEGTTRKEKAGYRTQYPKVMVQDAEPITGWTDFEKYLDINKRNIQRLDSKKGEVVVSFLVNADGNRSSYKIEQSLTPAQDAEALRLIKEGPSWHLLKGKRARVMVMIGF